MSRVTDIRHVAYGVADFAAERDFYAEKWGLEEVGSNEGMAWFAAAGSEEHHVVRLRASDANHVDLIALAAASAADVDALHVRVADAGCRIVHAPQPLAGPGGGYGFRFFSLDGLPFEVSSDVARRTARAIDRWEGLPVRIGQGSGNAVIAELVQRLNVPIHRLLFESFYNEDRLTTANADHQAMMPLILGRRADEAEQAMRTHIEAGFVTLSRIENEFYS